MHPRVISEQRLWPARCTSSPASISPLIAAQPAAVASAPSISDLVGFYRDRTVGEVLRLMRCSRGCGGRVLAVWLETGPVLNQRVRPRRVSYLEVRRHRPGFRRASGGGRLQARHRRTRFKTTGVWRLRTLEWVRGRTLWQPSGEDVVIRHRGLAPLVMARLAPDQRRTAKGRPAVTPWL